MPDEPATSGSDQPRRRRRRRRRRPSGGTTQGGGTGQGGATAGASGGTTSADGSTSEPAAPRSSASRRRRRRRPSGGGGGGAQDAGATSAGTKAGGAKTPATGGGGKKRTRRAPSGPRKKIPTTREVSAGGVVWRPDGDGGIEVVLASRRTRRGQLAWGLAKGGIEDGETREEAALREVREETGLTADIEADLGDTKYMYVWEDVRIRKTVHFFLMRHTGGDVDDRDDEMEEIRWFPLERAMKRAAYRGEREVLQRAADLLR